MNKLYPLQIWLTSVVVIAPLLLVLVGQLDAGKNLGGLIPFFIPFGLLYSLPVLLFCEIAFVILGRKIHSPVVLKVWLDILVVAGIVITFTLLSGSMAVLLGIIYSGSVLLASLLYPIFKKVKPLVQLKMVRYNRFGGGTPRK